MPRSTMDCAELLRRNRVSTTSARLTDEMQGLGARKADSTTSALRSSSR
jgi:hypothetical protein